MVVRFFLRESVRMKQNKVFILACCTFSLLIFGIGLWVLTQNRTEIFCHGENLELGVQEKIILSSSLFNSAEKTAKIFRARLGSDTSNSEWNLASTDHINVVRQATEDGELISFKESKTGHIAIRRRCGSEPKCEVVRYDVPDSKILKSEKEKQTQLEKQAYQSRVAAAIQAEIFAKARERAMRAKEDVEKLKKFQPSKKEVQDRADQELKTASELAAEEASKLSSLSADAHEINKASTQLNLNSSLSQVQMKSAQLKLINSEKWCR